MMKGKKMKIGKIALRAALMTAALAAPANLIASPAAPQAAPVGQARPNIIFILLDDLPIDNLGVDNPRLKTPNLDYMVKNGVYIPRAAVTSSLCSPSRATILTGMTTRNHRVVDNSNSSEEGLTFFPKYLQDAGYQTAFFGKWHMGSDTDARRPGFDRWVSFAGQGSYLPKGDFNQNDQQVLNVDGKHVDRTGYITDELTQYQMDWLKSGRDKSKPFFLYMSHKAVHGPCIAPPRYANQYSGATMTVPASYANTDENNRGKPMWVLNQRNSWHGIDIRYPNGTDNLIAERRACDEVLSGVDDSVGATLKFLKDNKLDKNTIIVFFSDNGSMWGAHGLTDKRTAYEESVRVPMIAYAPWLFPKGVRSDARIRNLDLAPTFLDMAGVKAPTQFEGHSVLPLLEGKVKWSDWPQDDFIYEYYWEAAFPMTPTTFSIVHGDMKYIAYHGVWDRDELYDLSKDPGEMNNLATDPALAKVRADLRARLFKNLTNKSGEHVVPYTERTELGFVFRNAEGAKQAEFPPEWQLTPPANGKPFEFFPLFKKASQK